MASVFPDKLSLQPLLLVFSEVGFCDVAEASQSRDYRYMLLHLAEILCISGSKDSSWKFIVTTCCLGTTQHSFPTLV